MEDKRTFITENTPLENIWQNYFISLTQETMNDGLKKEAEFLIDIGWSFLAWDERRLPKGLQIKINDEIYTVENYLEPMEVQDIWNRIDTEMAIKHNTPERERDKIRINRILTKSNIVSNAIYENAFLRRVRSGGLAEQLKEMERYG